jgi:hypothetical protein
MWAQTHGSGEATNACVEVNLHITQERQLAAMQVTCPGRSLNASLTSRATITSPSTSTLPHAKLSPRHSSTLYDTRRPRLRLTRGKSSKYSGRLRQEQTTQGKGQVSQSEQLDPATRRLSYGPPWTHYLGGYQDRLLGGRLGLLGLCHTAPDGVGARTTVEKYSDRKLYMSCTM